MSPRKKQIFIKKYYVLINRILESESSLQRWEEENSCSIHESVRRPIVLRETRTIFVTHRIVA